MGSYPSLSTWLVLLQLFFATGSTGSKILFYFGVSTYSHRIAVWPLVEQLAARNHEITFLSPFPPKNKPSDNVTEFSPKALQDFIGSRLGGESDVIQFRLVTDHVEEGWAFIQELGVDMCQVLMKDPEYLAMIQTNRYDLVIIDGLNNECALGIVHQHKSSYMIFDTSHIFMWQYDQYGFPAETSWIPDLAIPFPQEMSFRQRFVNTLQPLLWYYSKVHDVYPRIEGFMNSGFNLSQDRSISLQEMEKDCRLILTNSHFSLDTARSLPPLAVPVGGLHVEAKINPLPKDLATFIEDSEDGFIYISFGSVAQISKVKREMQDIFFSAIGNSACRFVWKWEGDTIPEAMPKNVFTAKWMPQNDILAHPKIRGFMTHGGLLGIEEAAFHGVPLIAFPVFAEQDYNSERLHRLGYGIRLEFKGLKQEHIQNVIKSILTEPKYKEKMLEISRIFKDRQVSPLESAVWWTEYVLRHKGETKYLMPYGRYQSWFVRRNLDVWGSIFGSVFLVIGVTLGLGLRKRSSNQHVSSGKKLN